MFNAVCHLSSCAHQHFPCHLYLFSVGLGFLLQRPSKVIVLQGEMPWHQLLGSWKSRATSSDSWGPALSEVKPSYVESRVLSWYCKVFPSSLMQWKRDFWCVYVQREVVSLEVNQSCAVGFCFLLIFSQAEDSLLELHLTDTSSNTLPALRRGQNIILVCEFINLCF